ncbi:MAG: PLD nuclease N-terminal domain-containing protein [Ekhidna sp.]|uniref:PLD nuclease N-terminal domain-containing protein n=1 Tax=Ekhidna sp. TaxID=2608089 RepID=UPI0032EF4ABF
MDSWIIISIFAAAIAIYSMIDILQSRISLNRKMVWFAVVVIIPLIGPLVYLLKRKAIANAK